MHDFKLYECFIAVSSHSQRLRRRNQPPKPQSVDDARRRAHRAISDLAAACKRDEDTSRAKRQKREQEHRLAQQRREEGETLRRQREAERQDDVSQHGSNDLALQTALLSVNMAVMTANACATSTGCGC